MVGAFCGGQNPEHITAIRRVCGILPVSKVVVETAEFDLQLLKAIEEGKPVPQGEDYQKGEMYGHYNVRQYVLWRDDYTCQCCGATESGFTSTIWRAGR